MGYIGSGSSSSNGFSSGAYTEMGKCGSCIHWGGNATGRSIGKCFNKGSNNPHYFNGDRLSADDGCQFWSKR